MANVLGYFLKMYFTFLLPILFPWIYFSLLIIYLCSQLRWGRYCVVHVGFWGFPRDLSSMWLHAWRGSDLDQDGLIGRLDICSPEGDQCHSTCLTHGRRTQKGTEMGLIDKKLFSEYSAHMCFFRSSLIQFILKMTYMFLIISISKLFQSFLRLKNMYDIPFPFERPKDKSSKTPAVLFHSSKWGPQAAKHH